MKTIINNGKVNSGIQNCSISEDGIEIIFHNNDLADKFALSLNMSGISCIKEANKIIVRLSPVFCID